MAIERIPLINFLRKSSLFRDLNDSQANYVADRLEEVNLEAGQELYSQNSEAAYLYIVYYGQVDLKSENAQNKSIKLAQGDVFGLEALSASGHYRTGAFSIGTTLVLRMNGDYLSDILHNIPTIHARLALRADSYHLVLSHRFDWLRNNETIYFLSHIHPLFLYFKVGIPGSLLFVDLGMLVWTYLTFGAETLTLSLLAGIAMVLVIWMVWNYIDWTNDYSIFTDQRVVFQEKVLFFYDTRREVPLNAIRSVDTRQSQLGLIFGFADVVVRVFSDQIILPHIRHAKDVAQFLDEQRLRVIGRQNEEEKQKFKEEIQERINRTVKPIAPQPASPPRNKRKPQAYLGNARTRYLMRFEQGGMITYRTHIIHLIARTWIPFLILVVVLALVVSAFISRPSLITSPSTVKIILLFYGLLVFGLLLVIWYRVEDWRNDIYVISDSQIIDRYKKPIGREEVRTTSLDRIDAVRFEQKGLWALIFNFGTVFVRVGQSELTFDNVAKPSEVQREILGAMAKRAQLQRQESLKQERERMADWIQVYYDVVENPGENPEPPE